MDTFSRGGGPAQPVQAYDLGEGHLVITISNTQPVELVDLTTSLLSIADEYKRFTTSRGLLGVENARLFVKTISAGSIVADLVQAAVDVSPLMTQAALQLVADPSQNPLNLFAGYLKDSLDEFIGRKKEEKEKPLEKPLEKQNLENQSNMVNPVAKDNGSNLNVSSHVVQGDTTYVGCTFNVNSLEANAAQNGIQRRLKEMQEPITGVYNNVLLSWHQARNTPESTAGDKGIIQSIARNQPVRVRFANDQIKSDILQDESNIFQLAYEVDVRVEAIGDAPKLYVILKLHDKFPKDEPGTIAMFGE